MIGKFFVLLVGVLWISCAASATTMVCGIDTINNVAIGLSPGSGNTLSCGSMSFSNFIVTAIPTGSVTVGISSLSGFAGGIASLEFQLGQIVGTPADILMFYQVTGGLSVVDLKNGGTNVSIQEVVCAVPFTGPACSSQLATLIVPGQGTGQSPIFAVTSPAYIKKDIQFGSVGAFISDFSNSHGVPEPLSFALLGSGLLCIGLFRRISRRNL